MFIYFVAEQRMKTVTVLLCSVVGHVVYDMYKSKCVTTKGTKK